MGTELPTSLGGLLAQYEVAGDRRLRLKTLASADERGDAEGRQAGLRGLAQLPDVGVLDSIRAGAELVRRINSRRWLDIQQAREEGWSWAEIGAALGMSKQAAWELYRTAIEHQEHYVPDLHDADRALGDDGVHTDRERDGGTMSKLADAERYLITERDHPITVRELARHLQVHRTTAGDYLHQLRREGRAEVASTSGQKQLWVPVDNPPDPTVRTKRTHAADRRAAQGTE
jgi:hypothetical protein